MKVTYNAIGIPLGTMVTDEKGRNRYAPYDVVIQDAKGNKRRGKFTSLPEGWTLISGTIIPQRSINDNSQD